MAASETHQASLPELKGRLLWSYRLAWSVLAIGAVTVSIFVSIQTGPLGPAVVLRLFKSAVLVSVAGILLYRRQRDPVAALVSLTFLTWTITSSFDFASTSPTLQLVDRFRFLLFAVALLLFPDGRWQSAWARAVARASGAVFLLGAGEALRLISTRLFLPLAVPCVIAAIVSLVCRFRASADYLVKQQLKWVALGLIAGVGLILCARVGAVFAEARNRAMPIVWDIMFQLGIIILALGFLVSLLRFRLFDAEAVISRSAAYAALTIALVATFGGTEAAIENVGQLYLGMNVGSISGAMAAAVAAALLNPLHHRLTEWAEDRFQPDLAQLKRQMPELLARFGSSASTEGLYAAVLPRINAAIHATRSAFVVDGRIVAATGVTVAKARRWARLSFISNAEPANRDSDDLLFPLRLPVGSTAPGATAWIAIGPRPDGTLYGREDLDALRSTFPALRRALTAARNRDALDRAINDRELRLRTEIDRIRDRLDTLESSQA